MKTVKVRIAVAVDRTGAWNASGWSTGSAADAMSLAVESVAEGERRYWLTAELTLPESAEEVDVEASIDAGAGQHDV